MSLVTSSPAIICVAADVSPLIIPAGEKFEPTHVGCYDEIDERPARQGIRFPAGANVAQAFGHDGATETVVFPHVSRMAPFWSAQVCLRLTLR